MDETEIMERIHQLVQAERTLRDQDAAEGAGPGDRAKMARLEETLDQCWDLLRQRRAHAEFGQDADGSSARGVDTVEGYLQ